ncbi:HAD family hydrolase [Chachezhania antarctica]|uniref:HAD family hydrolase n=1 Tax=Chachezhania antarctica TaxID=2340860 RepID=UPI000EABE702|nr:HAD family phosphatase [Chachezhania antarctica]|tara:strand:- start:6710 stop:7336 length:627 start_codon:yes stop_codon:yes gene_type:complete
MATPISAVIFDIGNVLINWNPEHYFDRTYGEERRKALFETVDLHGMNIRVDKGEHFTSVIEETIEMHPDWALEIKAWHDDWIQLASPAIPHSVRLRDALRAKGIPVFALTNFGVETFEIARAEYPFLEEFDRKYVSGHMAVIKPDPQIYAILEEDCALDPESLLFADDRPENIEAAAARGWQTHLFEHPQGWADRLVAEGLLTKEEAA